MRHSTLYGVGEVKIGDSASEIIEYLDGLLVGENVGEVGEYEGEVGEYVGEVGAYVGEVGSYFGEVGAYDGEVGE